MGVPDGAVVAVTIEEEGGASVADAAAGRRVRIPSEPEADGSPRHGVASQLVPTRARTLVRMTDLRPRLRELFGFAEFRPGQEQVVRAAVEGRDTLALMPTGSGKSLTYQLAAMLRPEPTLVLSPLIALMKDQVDKLPPEIAAHGDVCQLVARAGARRARASRTSPRAGRGCSTRRRSGCAARRSSRRCARSASGSS